ncbi:MAG: acyl-ACP--UDP-N-acetylglucosamine O-acyltransferase [Candidatus Schekmanbacteria bacterium]|nr:acyl-ACP--UDP-N-acetylglucosamine O-acyltransferase [Candidatus Schekmanbacteria bacterium]
MSAPVACHSTAVVSADVELGEGVSIAPFAVLEGPSRIGAGAQIGAHALIGPHTLIGARCRLFPHSVVGTEPQDLKYKGEPTRLEIGEESIIREFVTVHRGTVDGGGLTRVGPRCLLMATCHVAHDCELGEGVIMANGAAFGGHVKVESWAIIGGLVGVHQFVRIGLHAFVGGCSAIAQDIPPFMAVSGSRSQPHGLNTVGLRRRGFSPERIRILKNAYDLLYRSNLNTSQALCEIDKLDQTEDIVHLTEFIRGTKRGISK